MPAQAAERLRGVLTRGPLTCTIRYTLGSDQLMTHAQASHPQTCFKEEEEGLGERSERRRQEKT